MASLLEEVRPKGKQYLDRTQFETLAAQEQAKQESKTVYVGNLNVLTLEEQVHALFSQCGPVYRVIMGLHRVDRVPCGFCFVEFLDRKSAVNAQLLLNQTKFDGSFIKVEMDPGFREGRQYGRARSGGQARAENPAFFPPTHTSNFGQAAPLNYNAESGEAFNARPFQWRGRGGRGRYPSFRRPRFDRDSAPRHANLVYVRPRDEGDEGDARGEKRQRETENGVDEEEEEARERRDLRRRRRARRGESDPESSDSD